MDRKRFFVNLSIRNNKLFWVSRVLENSGNLKKRQSINDCATHVNTCLNREDRESEPVFVAYMQRCVA